MFAVEWILLNFFLNGKTCFLLLFALLPPFRFFIIFFFSRLAFYNPTRKQVSQTHPVTVIICSRDEAENLVKNLPGALIQQYGTTHEVIVVNDNSLDESKYILEAYQKTYKQLQLSLIHISEPTRQAEISYA